MSEAQGNVTATKQSGEALPLQLDDHHPRYLNQIICGDARLVLPQMPERSIDLNITDPPYGDNVGYGPQNVRIKGNEHPLLALAQCA